MSDRPAEGTVLVVEDDPVHVRLYEHVLAEPAAGRRVRVAGTLAEAERALAAERVSLVLLDLFLPDGDGRAFLETLRGRAETAALPVIVVAGSAAMEAKIDCYALGAGTVLEKPVPPQILRAAVAGVLQRAERQREAARRDGATGLPNRAALAEAWALARADGPARGGTAVAVAAADAWERVAPSLDEGARLVGAALTGALGGALGAALGGAAARSCVARWREDAIALLLPGLALDAAVAAVERLRRAAAPAAGGATLSAGVVVAREGATLEATLDEAERQLTAARLAGGDRVSWPGAPAERGGAGARTILVAEDDEVVAALLQHRLTREGFTVVHARDGLAALDVAAERPLTLAVLDILMPGLDGFEVLTRLRRTERGARLPILMLTGLGNERDVERALALGANDYVIKPFSPVEVTARVHRLLRRG